MESWLSVFLKKHDADDEVFGPYILEILDTDDPREDKSETLLGVLSGFIVSRICWMKSSEKFQNIFLLIWLGGANLRNVGSAGTLKILNFFYHQEQDLETLCEEILCKWESLNRANSAQEATREVCIMKFKSLPEMENWIILSMNWCHVLLCLCLKK